MRDSWRTSMETIMAERMDASASMSWGMAAPLSTVILVGLTS